jgi:hypothetical protein
MTSAVLLEGCVVQLWRGSPKFEPFAMLGGVIWYVDTSREPGAPPRTPAPRSPPAHPPPRRPTPATDALSGREPVARVGFFPNETRVKYFFETV